MELLKAGGAMLLAAACLALPATAAAQRTPPGTKKCAPLRVDVRKGTVNGLGPATPLARVMKKLPCYTGGTPEGDLFNYGGGSFYNQHKLYFYTYLRFIEVRAGYEGATTIPVFGRSRESLLAELNPTGMQGRPTWGTAADEFVTMDWGCLQLTFTGDRATNMRFYTRPCGTLYNPR